MGVEHLLGHEHVWELEELPLRHRDAILDIRAWLKIEQAGSILVQRDKIRRTPLSLGRLSPRLGVELLRGSQEDSARCIVDAVDIWRRTKNL